MNKYFLSPESITNLKELHEDLVGHLIQRWKRFDGEEVEDLEYEFYRHSISFVLGSLIGNSYWNKLLEYDPYVDELARKFQLVFETSSKLNVLPSVRLVQRLGLPVWKTFESAVGASLDASRNVVRKAFDDLSQNGLLYKLASENMPEDVTSALVSDLLIAAGDTTAFTSQWAVYLLGRNRSVQEAVRRDKSLIRGVVRETLRLFPSAAFIARVLPNAETIDGYDLQKEELVLLSLYTAGRDERVYPSADQFLPDRWTKEGTARYKGVLDVNSYLPFAMGARSCIGARLANAQLNMTIARLLENYDLDAMEETDMVLRLVPVPSKPVRLKIRSRKKLEEGTGEFYKRRCDKFVIIVMCYVIIVLRYVIAPPIMLRTQLIRK
uniref:Cholesterol side-chain cleavage enzyme, mitochondrial n=1 Tax=Lygus hesperus TaxID=30085 RepID=A0A0A9Y244_LYGHE